jgi:RimJ/RimL family protein N-acetyltransferase
MGPDELSVRGATQEDREAIWLWWNDPVTRKMMKNNDPVPWSVHCQWFDQLLKDDSRVLCVGLANSEPFSAVRFDLKGPGIYEVSINLNPAFRGKGLATPILMKSIAFLQQKHSVGKLFATLKKVNAPSMRTFARAGFRYADNPIVKHKGLERFDPATELYCERIFRKAKKLSQQSPLPAGEG